MRPGHDFEHRFELADGDGGRRLGDHADSDVSVEGANGTAVAGLGGNAVGELSAGGESCLISIWTRPYLIESPYHQ